MSHVGGAAALVLALVFAWAGVAKVRTPATTATSFHGLGLPAARLLSRVVPVVEIGIALGLVVAPRLAAWIAVALLLAFSAVIARAVAAGSTVTCACFGTTAAAAGDDEDARPVSVVELVRNAGLGGLAVIASGSAGGVVRTSLPALVIVSVVVALSRVAFAAVDLRRAGGHLFSTPLAGELRR